MGGSPNESVGRILINLSKPQRTERSKGLVEFVEWLFEQKGDSSGLSQFRSDLATVSQKASNQTRDQERAEFAWWTALDESRDVALLMAFRIVLERDILAGLEKELPEDTRQLSDVSREVEERLVKKLKEFLGAPRSVDPI